MKVILRYYAIFLVLIFVIFSCAATNQSDMEATTSETNGEDIDGLFGISSDEESATLQENEDEAEVLRLLGISEVGSKSEKIEEDKIEEENNIEDRDADEKINAEIETLENQVSQKETEIADLRSEIATKDQKIEGLETRSRYNKQPNKSIKYSASGNFQEDYQGALEQYYNKNYKGAINAFEALLSKDYSNSLSDNCQYWIGECYYGLTNFNQAIVEFTKVFSFNKSNKFDDAQLKLGLCYWRLGDKSKAREEFGRLISDYPKSEYTDKAESFISRL